MKFETIHKRIGREMIRHLPFVAVALMVSLTASAQTTKRIPLPPSQNPRNADLPIAAARTTVQVVLPAGDRGALVEVDVIAVRPK
jgi:hypothetical protein